MLILFLLGLVFSVIFIFFVSIRYKFPALPSILSHVVGFFVSALISSLIFSFMVSEPSFIFSDIRGPLGGGLSWTVVVFTAITTLLKPDREKVKEETTSYKSKLAHHHSTMQVFRTMFGFGLLSVCIGSFFASVTDLLAFVMYGVIWGETEIIPDSFIWMVRIIYILANVGISYFVFWFFLGRKKSRNNFELLPETQNESSAPQSLPVKLWTPRFIGFATFFLGFPGGIALSALNWYRMGLNKKVTLHIVIGAIGAFALVIILLLLPGNQGRGIGVLVNFGMLYYLYNQTKKDIEEFKANNHEVENAHWFGGCMISLLMIGLYFILALVAVIILDTFGFSILE